MLADKLGEVSNTYIQKMIEDNTNAVNLYVYLLQHKMDKVEASHTEAHCIPPPMLWVGQYSGTPTIGCQEIGKNLVGTID